MTNEKNKCRVLVLSRHCNDGVYFNLGQIYAIFKSL
jgi:hypothetical protein